MIDNHKVQCAIVIDVRRSDARRVGPGGDRCLASKSARRRLQEDRHSVITRRGDSNVQITIDVKVGHRHRRRRDSGADGCLSRQSSHTIVQKHLKRVVLVVHNDQVRPVCTINVCHHDFQREVLDRDRVLLRNENAAPVVLQNQDSSVLLISNSQVNSVRSVKVRGHN